MNYGYFGAIQFDMYFEDFNLLEHCIDYPN